MVHGLSHAIVTLIRTIEVRYGTQVVSALSHFGSGSIWPMVMSALCLTQVNRFFLQQSGRL